MRSKGRGGACGMPNLVLIRCLKCLTVLMTCGQHDLAHNATTSEHISHRPPVRNRNFNTSQLPSRRECPPRGYPKTLNRRRSADAWYSILYFPCTTPSIHPPPFSRDRLGIWEDLEQNPRLHLHAVRCRATGI